LAQWRTHEMKAELKGRRPYLRSHPAAKSSVTRFDFTVYGVVEAGEDSLSTQTSFLGNLEPSLISRPVPSNPAGMRYRIPIIFVRLTKYCLATTPRKHTLEWPLACTHPNSLWAREHIGFK